MGVWSWPGREQVWVRKMSEPRYARFSPDGKRLGVLMAGPANILNAGYEVALLDAGTGEELWRKPIEEEAAGGSFAFGFAFAGNGHLFVSTSKTGPPLRAFHTADGEPLEFPTDDFGREVKLAAAAEAPVILAYRQEGYDVLQVDADGAVRDLSHGSSKDLDGRSLFRGGAVSADGRQVLLATREECRVYAADSDVASAVIPVRGEQAHLFQDGKKAVVSYDHNLVLLPTAGWQPASAPGSRAHVGRIESMRFSPGGKLLATTDGEDVILWDLATGGALAKMRSPTADHDFRWLAFHPKEPILYGDTGPETWWWNVPKPGPGEISLPGAVAEPAHDRVLHMREPPQFISAAHITINARATHMLVVTNGFAILEEFSDDLRGVGKAIRQLTLEGWSRGDQIRHAALSADAKRAVLASSSDVRVYDLSPDRLVRSQPAQYAIPSPDARYFAVPPVGSAKTMAIHDVATGGLKATLTLPGEDAPGELLAYATEWSPNSARIAVAVRGVWTDLTGYIVWEVPSGKRLGFLATHRGRAGAFAFDPAGQRLAAANADGSVDLWDLRKAFPKER
jgi:WD40 repeat protein